MRSFLPKIVIGVIVYLLIVFVAVFYTPSKVFSIPNLNTKVVAAVGELYLNASGYISPYATVVMTGTDGSFIRSTIADSKGNFYFIDVLIKKSFSGFCLTAIDFYRLGESTTCFSLPPAENNITMKGIFLPPTLGLSKTQVAAGSSVKAFGYTMPGAIVILHLSDGTILTTTADAKGYYEFDLKNLKAGIYDLFAKAQFESKESLTPTKKIRLMALSLWEQFLASLKDLIARVVKFVTDLVTQQVLWIAIPIIILIIILILKLWPQRFTFIYDNKLYQFLFKRKKKLHHWWWMGY